MSKSWGVHGPSLRSNESTWLSPPPRNTKMQVSAEPRGFPAAGAARNGPASGAKSKPARTVDPARSNMRRDSAGMEDEYGGMGSVVQLEFALVDERPQDIFGTTLVVLGQNRGCPIGLGPGRIARQGGEKQFLHDLGIRFRRLRLP